MKSLLNKYINKDETIKIKEERYNRVKKLVEFLKEKDIDFLLNKNLFFNKESYLGYTLICYAEIVEKMKVFTSHKIDFDKLKKDIEVLSIRLNAIDNDFIIIDFKTKDFVDNIFSDALDIVRKSTFNEYEKFIGCIAILEYVKSEDIIHNHTEDFHINTIFTDYVIKDRIQNAEIIIHETAHIYFNYFLEYNQIELDVSKLYLDAPWKSEIKRHERGFLHGVFAFSNVLAFYKELNNKDFNFSEEEKVFIKSYIEFREQQVKKVKNDALEVIKKYPKKLQCLIIEILKKVN